MNFALILDPAIKWLNTKDFNESEYWLETVRKGFTKLQYSIESATHFIKLDGMGDID